MSVERHTQPHGTNWGCFETPPTHPGLLEEAFWRSGWQQHHEMMRDASRLVHHRAYPRPRGWPGNYRQNGAPLIDYTLSDFDRVIDVAARTRRCSHSRAAGAHTIYLPHGTLPTLKVENGQDCQRGSRTDQLPHLSWRTSSASTAPTR
jgi:hypothetical protein